MTLVLVSPGGGRPDVIAAGMAAAAGARGVRVNLGMIDTDEISVDSFISRVSGAETTAELVIVFVRPDAAKPPFLFTLCQAAEEADLDLVLHVACSPNADEALAAVEALREVGLEPSGLIIDAAPTDEKEYTESRQFLAAAVSVPVVGALPVGAEALPAADFQRQSVTWFDEDDAFEDDDDDADDPDGG